MRSSVGFVASFVFVAVGCSVGGDDGHEALATRQQAMNCGGAPDDGNAMNFAPYFRAPYAWPNTTSGTCTAVLVTPVWALTANHCVTNADSTKRTVERDMFLVFSNDPNGSPQVKHTYNAMIPDLPLNPARLRVPGPFEATREFAAADIALVRLDQRVTEIPALSGLVPKHPPRVLGTPSCIDKFNATIIGYTRDFKLPLFACKTDSDFRNFNNTEGVKRACATGGDIGPSIDPACAIRDEESVFFQKWPYVDYPGPVYGDSGGPLITAPGGQLCGVFSMFTWHALTGVAAYWPTLDSANNAAWIEENIKDGNGNFMGECAGVPNGPDRDRDQIPDACDNCPDIPNTDQTDSDKDGLGNVCDPAPFSTDNTDSDADGVGDKVDNCPGVKNGYRPCNSDSDCFVVQKDSSTKPLGKCIGWGFAGAAGPRVGGYGTCEDTGGAPRSVCMTDANCGGSPSARLRPRWQPSDAAGPLLGAARRPGRR